MITSSLVVKLSTTTANDDGSGVYFIFASFISHMRAHHFTLATFAIHHPCSFNLCSKLVRSTRPQTSPEEPRHVLWYCGAITRKIKHAIKLKTSPARCAVIGCNKGCRSCV